MGRSEPEKGKAGGGSSRKDSSSVASGAEDRQTGTGGTTANSHVNKYFGPLFEEYRQKKVEMRVELLGPAIHTPFSQLPVMKGSKALELQASTSRKAVDIAGSGRLKLGLIELKSNDFANSIIDESQSMYMV